MVPIAMKRLEADRTNLMRRSGTKTKYPGVYNVGKREYRVRGKVRNPRTGKPKEVDRIIKCKSAAAAAHKRADLLDEAMTSSQAVVNKRVRVGEYARSWMSSKMQTLDQSTAYNYADLLDRHILPALGDFYYDALTRQDVQAWIDGAMKQGRVLKNGKRKPYAAGTVNLWFGLLRTMTTDAVEDLDLERNPTKRVKLPKRSEPAARNTLTSDELGRFLSAMQSRYPQHLAITCLLAFTGLRFCHASALRWSDWDEKENVIRVQRKQARGVVGEISRKKKAPRELPVEPALVAILRQHRQTLATSTIPGGASNWMFPSAKGTLRVRSSLERGWQGCMAAIGLARRFTVHGLRYTFTDLTRRANADAIVRRALTGHATTAMQEHYSTVNLDEKRSAIAGVHRQVAEAGFNPAESDEEKSEPEVGTEVGTKRRKNRKNKSRKS